MNDNAPEEIGFSPDRLMRINRVMQRYVDERKMAGIVTLVARHNRVAHFAKFGWADIETSKPMAFDTIFRIFSMTKPVTSVALMMLFEQGLVRLEDPVTRFIPEFKKLKVLNAEGELDDLEREITVHDPDGYRIRFSEVLDADKSFDEVVGHFFAKREQGHFQALDEKREAKQHHQAAGKDLA